MLASFVMEGAASRKKRRVKLTNNYKGWCNQTGSRLWLERINAQCISPKQFYNRYIRRRMPVILVSPNTDCLRAFSILNLTRIAGDCRVAVEKADSESYQAFGRADAGSRRKMKFADFLNRMCEDELYCSTQPVPEDRRGPKVLASPHVQRLISRGLIPEQLPLMGNLTLHQINTWIGCSEDGTSSGFHHDFHDNFYMLLAGEKQFRISSPNFTEEDPTYGCGAGSRVVVHENGLISYEGKAIRDDGARKEDVIEWKISKNPSNVEQLRDDLQEQILSDAMDRRPNSCTYPPSFCRQPTAHGEYLTETIKAGEMLYLPAGFFHEVISFNTPETTTHHMAVNYWYYPPRVDGTFEQPYLDDFWKERWERLAMKSLNRVRLNRDRMRRNKLPLQFQYTKKEILRFIRRLELRKRQ